jgi:phosphoribosylformimino-5-aminoimidazole carboxamide ribotide isomerase
MEVIPVLDLMRGVAVHARQGARKRYRPVESVLTPGQAGDAMALGSAYRTEVHAWRCYVADLDAIEGWPPQLKLIRSLTDPEKGFGPGLLVDAGVSNPRAAEELLEAGVTTVVVGLETLGGFEDLKALVQAIGGERVIFSLDLLEGRPVRRRTRRIATQEAVAVELGARAAEAGCSAILVLDLSAVGSAAGPRNLDLIAALQRLIGVPIYAGGGVRSLDDLRELEAAGCDAALVGTALHAGTLKPSAES